MLRYPLRLKLGAIAALLLFAAALVVVGLVAWRQDSLIWRVGEDVTWHTYKLDRDTVQLRSFLARSETSAEALQETRLRFELLYSRLTLLQQGDIAHLIGQVPLAERLVAEIGRQLRALDETVQRLEVLDAAAREQLDQRLRALSGPAERLIITLNGYLAEEATRERERLQELYGLLLALILGMSLAAMMVVTFLFREARDNAAARRALETLSAELEVTARRAESASQAKSEFLATVSHEIRTPLNGVIGMSDLLVDQPLADDARHYAETIHDSARRLLELINDILDFSKIEAGRLDLESRPLALTELVEGVVALFTPHAEARGNLLSARLDPALPAQIISDPGRLRQVLLNLLSNAIKFTEDGEVRLEVRRSDEEDELRFEVIDTGLGVAVDQQPLLFEPFRQGDPSTARRFGGTGLGLAISKRLVEALGGRIGMVSELGVGSRCWFVLPLVEVQAPRVDAGRDSEMSGKLALAEARLLVVEDNPVNQQVAEAMLMRLGCRVSLADSGTEALSMLARERFDLIFMDVQMPDLDGLEVTGRLRALGGWLAEVPVVAMTAGGPDGDQARCLAAGMNGYLTKPLFQDALLGVLRRHLPRSLWRPGERLSRRRAPLAPETVVDPDVVEALRESLGREGLAALIQRYRDQLEAQLAALDAAASSGEASRLERLAHQLKGESASLGAVKVAGLATQLEHAARDGRLTVADETLAALRLILTPTLEGLELDLKA